MPFSAVILRLLVSLILVLSVVVGVVAACVTCVACTCRAVCALLSVELLGESVERLLKSLGVSLDSLGVTACNGLTELCDSSLNGLLVSGVDLVTDLAESLLGLEDQILCVVLCFNTSVCFLSSSANFAASFTALSISS